MTRPIFLSEADKKSLLEEIMKQFRRKMFDGKFNLSYTYHYDAKRPKARIVYTREAWDKMKGLILGFDTEIGWHGVIERYQDDHSFIVKDIIVYPQRITASTVQTDDEPYHKFLMDCFDKDLCISFHGHSHVNFSVSPSGVDDKDREDKMENQRDGFYVFTIQNKRGEKNYWIYDYDNNVIYEKEDVVEEVLNAEDSVWEFIENAKKIAVKTTGTTAAPKTPAPYVAPVKKEEKEKIKQRNNYFDYDPFWDDDDDDDNRKYAIGAYLPGYYPYDP